MIDSHREATQSRRVASILTRHNRAIRNRVRQTEINNPVKIAIARYLNMMSSFIKNTLYKTIATSRDTQRYAILNKIIIIRIGHREITETFVFVRSWTDVTRSQGKWKTMKRMLQLHLIRCAQRAKTRVVPRSWENSRKGIVHAKRHWNRAPINRS